MLWVSRGLPLDWSERRRVRAQSVPKGAYLTEPEFVGTKVALQWTSSASGPGVARPQGHQRDTIAPPQCPRTQVPFYMYHVGRSDAREINRTQALLLREPPVSVKDTPIEAL